MRQISLTLNDNDLDEFLLSIKSIRSAQIVQSKHVVNDLPQWQMDELDKSIQEIEDGTVQSEDWSSVKDRLFAKHSVK